MSRNIHQISSTSFIRGNDHILGKFYQVTDLRYAKSGKDEQGEGYVMDWDEAFGFSINLIGATIDDIYNLDKLKKLTDEFCLTL